MIKNSDEYDSILHAGADMSFMEGFFKVNLGNALTAKLQLIELYTKEYEENLKNSKSAREENLASLLHSRNLCLIERTYMSYRITEIERTSLGKLSEEATIERAECWVAYAENDLKLNQVQMRLLRLASKLDMLIWGEERSTYDYGVELETRYGKNEFGEPSLIEELEEKYKFAQIALEDVLQHFEKQKGNEITR